jgi:hypothetical protein
MSMRNVLGVLEDQKDRLWSTFEAAVELADTERARLTLVKTYEPPRCYMWCGPFAVGGLCVPPDCEPEVDAGRLLARAAEFVPMEIPVTTMLLGLETQRELRRLVQSGAYDAVVASEPLLRRSRRLRRECRRDCIQTFAVAPTPSQEPGSVPAPVAPSTVRMV